MGIFKFLFLSFVTSTHRKIYILQTHRQQASVVPMHLPIEHHWLLIVISVINLCLYVYDSAICTTATHRTIFDTIKERLIRNELQWLSGEDKTLFQEDNWDECTPQCPKQRNDTDCAVFTCLFAK